MYELIGKVKRILYPTGATDVVYVCTRSLVVSVAMGDDTQNIFLGFMPDKDHLLNGICEGQEVRVFFEIHGREYEDRYYNSLIATKIEKIGTIICIRRDEI